MNHSESLSNILPAIVKMQAELKPAIQDTVNPQFRKKYADLGAIIESARPILAKHGLGVCQFPITDEGGVGMETVIIHESGEWMGNGVTIPLVPEPGRSSSAQVAGSNFTYLRRYGYSAVVGVYSEGDDDDGAGGAQRQQQNNASRSSNSNTQRVPANNTQQTQSQPVAATNNGTTTTSTPTNPVTVVASVPSPIKAPTIKNVADWKKVVDWAVEQKYIANEKAQMELFKITDKAGIAVIDESNIKQVTQLINDTFKKKA